MSAAMTISDRLNDIEQIRRVGQALWMLVGQSVGLRDLYWAPGLLGTGGDQLLWDALTDAGCLVGAERVLEPAALSAFLCALCRVTFQDEGPRLIWTLPPQLSRSVSQDYASAMSELIDGAIARVTIASPYLEARGVGRLHTALVAAMTRGVSVVLLTHGAEDLASFSSQSLAQIRSEAAGLPGTLTVFSALPEFDALLHLKIAVADGTKAIIGSANVTGKGLSHNLEVGVVLSGAAAVEIESMVLATIESNLVSKTFASR